MSSQTSTYSGHALRSEIGRTPESNRDRTKPGAQVYLLQPDPDSIIEVHLVDHPLDLPQEQFEALLIDSECEV
jgi:hypothetical protein